VGQIPTAADLNALLRDNMNETIPAKASRRSGYFASAGTNALAERHILRATAFETKDMTMTSTSFASHPKGPSLTFEHSGSFLAIYSARLYTVTGSSGTGGWCAVAPASSEESASLNYSVRNHGGDDALFRAQAQHLFTGHTPGETTVELQYQVETGTGRFAQCELIIMPF